MSDKRKYEYIGGLYVNKSTKGDTYLKGKIKIGDTEVNVIGFLNEVEIKNGKDAGKTTKIFSLAINTEEKEHDREDKQNKKQVSKGLGESKSKGTKAAGKDSGQASGAIVDNSRELREEWEF